MILPLLLALHQRYPLVLIIKHHLERLEQPGARIIRESVQWWQGRAVLRSTLVTCNNFTQNRRVETEYSYDPATVSFTPLK